MTTIQKQEEWEIVKIDGQFAAITIDENKRIWGLLRKYKGYKNVPDSETFTGYGLTLNSEGNYYCDGKMQGTFNVNKLEFFFLPIVSN